MEKRTLVFKIAVCSVLGLAVLWLAVLSVAFFQFTQNQNSTAADVQTYDIAVGGVAITSENAADVLGDGTVNYDAEHNYLTFTNATVECDDFALRAQKDLTVFFEGENKFICSSENAENAIYLASYMNRKDLTFEGGGTLEIVLNNESGEYLTGIVADTLNIFIPVEISLSHAGTNIVGIECGNLLVGYNGSLTVDLGTAYSSTGIFANNDIVVHPGCSIGVRFKEGHCEMSTGIMTYSSFNLMDGASVEVIGSDSPKIGYGIEIVGNFFCGAGSTVKATSGCDTAGVVCYTSIIDFGAVWDADTDAIGGVHMGGHRWEEVTYGISEEQHWRICSCGYTEIASYHEWTDEIAYDTTHHWIICSVCGAPSAKEAHIEEDACPCGFEKE